MIEPAVGKSQNVPCQLLHVQLKGMLFSVADCLCKNFGQARSHRHIVNVEIQEGNLKPMMPNKKEEQVVRNPTKENPRGKRKQQTQITH